jgi:hypothetical protein
MRRRLTRLKLASMTQTPRTVLLRLDLQPDTDQISSCIEHVDGSRRPFWSWLELTHELEEAIAEPLARVPPEEACGGVTR